LQEKAESQLLYWLKDEDEIFSQVTLAIVFTPLLTCGPSPPFVFHPVPHVQSQPRSKQTVTIAILESCFFLSIAYLQPSLDNK
jgi:hypothetical protein